MYYFIVNPGSQTGKAKNLWNDLEDRLKNAGIDYKVSFTTIQNDAEKIAARICREHPEMKRIVLAGGDGTVNEGLNGLYGYDSFILGYIPMGSSNDFARGLGIPQDPASVMENTVHPRRCIRIDNGLVISEDGDIVRKFGVSSGIGYDADICEKALHSKLKKFLNKFGLGKLVYYMIGFILIFTSKARKAVVVIDGKRTIKCNRLLFVAAMNTRYEGGGMPMAPAANPYDGKITACVAHDISRLKHLFLMTKIIKGKHINYKGVDQVTAKTIEVKAEAPMTIHTDGEIVGKNDHVTFSVFPEKIKMMI
ncbi:MAG: diacylglycerol kinase family lipid kinase [Lachnospiraceae bacterium]|nr:diacylglycerol kinase family lipid kinase [Lachnospiraceae bacterium]MBR4816102.1 diacylglycerol kinase family lipid kinase [Lachnospiraceae bacterium]